MHQILTLFITCHVPERIQLQLASLQLGREIFHWWVLQHDTPAHDSWMGLSEALTHYVGSTIEDEGSTNTVEQDNEEEDPIEHDPIVADPTEENPTTVDPIVGGGALGYFGDFINMVEPILPWTTEYNLRADSWVRNPNEPIMAYAERFYEEILSIVPQEETYEYELIELFWSGVPDPVRRFVDYPPTWTNVRHFITVVIDAARNVE